MNSPHVSTLRLHQLRLGELSEQESAPLRAHLDGCALCKARAGHQEAVRAEFVALPEPPALAPFLHPDPPAWPRFRSLFSQWPVAILLPVAALAFLWVRMDAPREMGTVGREEAADISPTIATPSLPATIPSEQETAPVVDPAPPEAAPLRDTGAKRKARPERTRSKGLALPKLEAWVQTGDSTRPVYKGESLGAGTRLQLRYDALGRSFVTLAGRDTNGLVEVYATIASGARGLTNAPFGLTLDDAHGEQVFFAVCSDTRPDPDAVKAALSQNPVRMDGAVVTSLVVRKD